MIRKMAALLFACALPACYADADFTGTYRCHGYDPYLKQNYKGTVIIKPQNTVYSLKMTYDTGEDANGTGGLFDPNTLSVVFQDTKDLKKVGLERYEVSEDKRHIAGYWVYLGQDQLGTEVCKKEGE
jgi:hypothetical protein